ncbi:hypothetical protein [Alkalibacillus almallahensis]|uniref:hypothetical protein n=1 Tax=Alkalibacillus almallahensis TaxID=1379154 RepID=UPI00141F9633|nr:hypothetical protein [Alkalibacillus almallahensis]NIK10899.1 hypothetical protein [Alkalibacillus almallahensis]
MKSTKYKLLKADFDFAQKELKQYRETIMRLRREKEQAYWNGYKQGRFDEKAKQLHLKGSD